MSVEFCAFCTQAQALVLNIAENIGGHVGTKTISVWELQRYRGAQVLSRFCPSCGIQHQDDDVDAFIAMQSMRR